MISKIKDQLDKLDIEFDNWFYETSLFDKANKYKPEDLITKLRKSDDIYDDGTDAILLKAEEPRVLVKSDGTYTYFATDLAYHYLKLKEYDRVIDIWGADHHGYIPRMEAGLKALGHDINKLDVHLIQFANLFRNGEKISMSTRKGQYVELDQLSDEIGKDAINFFYLTKNKDQHLDFDLDIAIKQNKNNPVYYIQYAHARIEKILNEVDDYKSKEYDFSSLNHELEKELISTLIKFEEVSNKTIMDLQPQLMTHYLQKLAQCFHSYYANIKILNDGKADYSKVHLIAAVQKVIKCGLDLLNINSPKVM
jgi:arginyl-tRNA synthetase